MDSPQVTNFTQRDLDIICIIERVGGVFSMLGCVFIIVTFLTSKAFHKPINRLVFFASWGNLITNIGNFMARDFVHDIDSFGCQFQGFVVQMFMPADALWTLAMAINVYLTFYHRYDAERLKKLELWYIFCCYGIPFLPAVVGIFVATADQGRMYTDATLWCWIGQKWDIFRVIIFYAPVWVVITITIGIYLRAGSDIYKQRLKLRKFGSSGHNTDLDTMNRDEGITTRTLEVRVTTATSAHHSNPATDPLPDHNNNNFSVTITTDKPNDGSESVTGEAYAASQAGGPAGTKKGAFDANRAAWSYTKCAMLFFTAILVTWVPSSANRVYSIVHKDNLMPLEFISAIVLPLQGFWNAIIYAVTSWTACREWVHEITRRNPAPQIISEFHQVNHSFRRSKAPKRNTESESMTELQTRNSSTDGMDASKERSG